jgi:hypothetical protein
VHLGWLAATPDPSRGWFAAIPDLWGGHATTSIQARVAASHPDPSQGGCEPPSPSRVVSSYPNPSLRSHEPLLEVRGGLNQLRTCTTTPNTLRGWHTTTPRFEVAWKPPIEVAPATSGCGSQATPSIFPSFFFFFFLIIFLLNYWFRVFLSLNKI